MGHTQTSRYENEKGRRVTIVCLRMKMRTVNAVGGGNIAGLGIGLKVNSKRARKRGRKFRKLIHLYYT